MGIATAMSIGLAACTSDDDALLSSSGGNDLVITAQLEKSSSRAWVQGDKVTINASGNTYTYTLGADGTLSPEGSPIVWGGSAFTIKAWTPSGVTNVNLTDQSSADKLSACDLISAGTTATSRYVFLIFQHQMTRMQWILRSVDSSYTPEQVADAQISFIGYGSVNFNDGVVTPSGNSDKPISGYETIEEGLRQGEAMMSPADMWGKPLVKVVIGGDEYVYAPDRTNASDAASAAGDLVAANWQKYYLSITRKTLSVEMVSSDVEWGSNYEFNDGDITDAKLIAEIASDVTDKPGYTVHGIDGRYISDRSTGFSISYTEDALGGLTWTGSCSVTRAETTVPGSTTATVQTYTFTDIKSDVTVSYLSGVDEGDYLYDNGAWGKDESRDGCKTIGRVFHAGRDSRDDSSYSLPKIRGYVVPLTFGNTAEMQWFSNQADTRYIQALADIPISEDAAVRESYYGGYNLTGLLNTALAPYSTDWAEQVPFWYAYKHIDMAAPALSSGWYIPTYAQLKDVCASQMYDKFSGVYWSSQVYPGTGNAAVGGVEPGDKTTLWAIRCGADQAVGYGWAIDRAKLLPILTF